jgi:hypothetical protein
MLAGKRSPLPLAIAMLGMIFRFEASGCEHAPLRETREVGMRINAFRRNATPTRIFKIGEKKKGTGSNTAHQTNNYESTDCPLVLIGGQFKLTIMKYSHLNLAVIVPVRQDSSHRMT